MEQYADVQQLMKKEDGQNRKPVYPPTVIQAVFDGKTGASLEAILAQFNSVYVQYQGTPKDTRLIIPMEMRRAGLTITYMDMDSNTITERANSAVQKDNDHWALDVNWSRVDELSLSGDISVSANGTWIINGTDTGVKAVGPKGDAGLTPWLKTIDNKLHFSYDNVTWELCSENIAAWFRWSGNKIQISRDNKTWTDLSGKFADNVYIKGYVATTSDLPSNAAQGDIYGVGPTYADEDTGHTNPIYRCYVRNANAWVDNGTFTSISAGVVQETGDSETEVMSQKAVSSRFVELGSFTGNPVIMRNKLYSYGEGFGKIEKSENFDCVFIKILDGTNKISVKNADKFTFIYFGSDSIENTYLATNASGKVYSGYKSCVINFSKSQNPNGLNDLIITQDGGGATKLELDAANMSIIENKNSINSFVGIPSIDYGHLCEVDSQSNYTGYKNSENYDTAWIQILEGTYEIKVSGLVFTNYYFFNDISTSVDNFISYNKNGKVPDGAKLCILNLKKSSQTGSYVDARIKQNGGDFAKTSIFEGYIKNVPIGKNYIDTNNLLKGYILDGGQIKPNVNGIMSNKLYLEEGKIYTIQGALYYGSAKKIYFLHYDNNDSYLGNSSYPAIYEEDSDVTLGTATFEFNSVSSKVSYVRVVLQTLKDGVFNPNLIQLEEGDVATEVTPYEGKDVFFIPNSETDISNPKKKIRFLSIGNSYSQDALSYVPFILKNMGVNVDVQIGILMQDSASLEMHVNNFNNNEAAYYFYLFDGGGAWASLGKKSIQSVLTDYKWDIICLQQSTQNMFDWEKYQPHCNNLINLISGYVKYAVKFVWYQPMVRPAKTNGGVNWNDAEILEHYQDTVDSSKRLLEETILEAVIPVGTAIQNVRTVPSLKLLGDYANNVNNSSGLGYLTANDGVHLQEGLPCQIGAYTFVLKLIELYGFNEHSIIGETTRVTESWTANKAIPGAHGNCIGSDDKNCIIAQKCAIMAVKNPYQITNMIELGIVDEYHV